MDAFVSRAFVGLGSNLDNPEVQVARAMDELAALPDCSLVARSSLYRSSPLAGMDQPDYINAVAMISTRLQPAALLDSLLALEHNLGRLRDGERWAPRTIDLDLLVVDDCTLDIPGLTLPHPGIAERNFVLLPLRELAPELEIPGLGPVSELPVNVSEPVIERLGNDSEQ